MRPIANTIAAEFCQTACDISPPDLFDMIVEYLFYMLASHAHGSDEVWEQLGIPPVSVKEMLEKSGITYEEFKQLTFAIAGALKYGFDDVLSDIANCIDVLHHKPDGGFLAKHLIELEYPGDAIAAAIKEKGCFVYSDDVQGAGALPMGLAEAFVNDDIDYHRRLFVQTKQVDIRLFRMCYVQLHAREIPAFVALVDDQNRTEQAGFYTSTYFTQFEPFQSKLEKRRRNRAKPRRNRTLRGHI